MLALGSFFHYAEGYTKPAAYDLTLPEFNVVGKLKDALFPSPRLDFYAIVQAKKKKQSPHGLNSINHGRERPQTKPEIEGEQYAPKVIINPVTREKNFGPYY